MKKNVVNFIDFLGYILGYICPIIGTVMLLAVIIVVISATGISIRYMRYSNLENPATVYEVGDIINNDYYVVATDSQNTLWLQKHDDDCTYVAIVSSDYPNLSFSEKIKWLWNTSLKDSISIEITEQVEKQDILHERN